MKAFRVLMVGAVALLAAVAVACGDNDGVGSDHEAVSGGGAGMVRPNTFMTYEGQRYELVNMLFEAMAPAEAFAVVGEATAADIDLRGDMRVFERAGDSTAVYTYSAPTADDGGLWLAWRATTS